MEGHRRRSIMFLMGYLVVFFLVLIVSFIGLQKGWVWFEIGMSHSLQNWIIIGFCLLAIVKVVWEISSIEGDPGPSLRRAA